MDMEIAGDIYELAVLQCRHLLGKLSLMVIVDDGEYAYGILPFLPLLLNHFFSNKIPQELGT